MRLEIIKGLSENRGKLQFGRMFERTGEPRNKKHTLRKQRRKKLFHCKQIICETQAKKAKERSSSNKEHKVNALASGADEGRDKLR